MGYVSLPDIENPIGVFRPKVGTWWIYVAIYPSAHGVHSPTAQADDRLWKVLMEDAVKPEIHALNWAVV